MKKVFLLFCVSLFSIEHTQNIKTLTTRGKEVNVKAANQRNAEI